MKLLLTNKNNQTLDLLNNKHRFILKAAAGLHGIETSVSESENPYLDGTVIDNVKALPRGIELTFILRGNVKESIEYFTSFVKSKQTVTLIEEENGHEISIKGIATIPPYNTMARSCELVLSIYCSQPYWEDLNYIVNVISTTIDLLHFPADGQYFTEAGRPFGVIDTSQEKTFTNEGDVAVGMLISLVALGDITNPRISCSTGEQNGNYMQLNITLQANDEVVINTAKGAKYITINGNEEYNGTPVLDKLEFEGADWLQLEQGDNTFNITAASGGENIYFTVNYKGRYE